ncbi:hypothetical protein IscW_ISCW011390 [Ixodes scapularis]|uniref:Uncharacterized protein n=1 Tax=Ixodes scapularis TaxID=6945 RepID=B7Q482_IXOSC|nr:hypothetical protein IscW_ISCW011390 [Ixodes scapularis]|eukprot:XP_002411497.1 hypothetical protein IscW_ISCW011390 [Ixodes scapularis]
MSSTMVQRVALYSLLCRLYGCFFIQNFREKTLANAKATWKALYTLYSISCFVLWFVIEMLCFTNYTDVVRSISDTLSKTLLLVAYGVLVVKLIVNLAVMFTKPDKMLTFFRKSEAFENNTGFTPRTNSLLRSATDRWNMVRALAVFMGFALYLTGALWYVRTELLKSIPPLWFVPVIILGTYMFIGFLLYDSVSHLFLRSCTNVLVQYIRAQAEVIKEAGKLTNFHLQSQSPLQMEAVRLRINKIRKLKESLNEIWAGPLIVHCASTLVVDCVILDAVFHDGIRKELYIILICSLYTSIGFIDLAYIGQTLIDEARSLKNTILMLPAFGAPDSYIQQLRYLHESVDPEGMCLGGKGFFALKRSLLVAMTGSVIIFGVILVQTSKSMALKINAA